MAEPIGIASGLVGLATFAFKSSVKLCETVNSYQSHQQRVRDLAEEAGALSGVLGSLTEAARGNADLNLSTLEVPLRRCGRACQEFEGEIRKCSSRSNGDRASFRDWARLRYMGEDLDGFRRLLAGYKMTINIALTDATLRSSIVTAEHIEGYNDLLNTARADLEDRLERIDEKLDLLVGQGLTGSESYAFEVKQVKEERLSTEKCLQICTQLSEHISQIQLSTGSSETTDSSSIPERITNEGLKEVKDSVDRIAARLADHEKKLFDRLGDRMSAATGTREGLEDIARLRDEWESTRESMNLLSRASNHFEKNISVIENHATGDAVQIMVSSNGKTLHGTNRGNGWRTRQIGGHLSDETVRQVSRDMLSVSIQNLDTGRPSPREQTDEVREGQHTGFDGRYGDGYKLSPKSSPDVAASSKPSSTGGKESKLSSLSKDRGS